MNSNRKCICVGRVRRLVEVKAHAQMLECNGNFCVLHIFIVVITQTHTHTNINIPFRIGTHKNFQHFRQQNRNPETAHEPKTERVKWERRGRENTNRVCHDTQKKKITDKVIKYSSSTIYFSSDLLRISIANKDQNQHLSPPSIVLFFLCLSLSLSLSLAIALLSCDELLSIQMFSLFSFLFSFRTHTKKCANSLAFMLYEHSLDSNEHTHTHFVYNNWTHICNMIEIDRYWNQIDQTMRRQTIRISVSINYDCVC